MLDRLALHTWTLDTTPLANVLAIAHRTGWGAVELRRLDFSRAAEAGQPVEAVIELVRASGLAVSGVGVEFGWMWAEGDERRARLAAFSESAGWAKSLNCPILMSPVDFGRGDLRLAAERVREVGALAAEHGLRLAIEHQTFAEQLNTLDRLRDLLDLAGHPACGLLLDTYHMQRTGASPRNYEDLAAEEIVYVQYSDVPRDRLSPDRAIPRLPPGRGSVPFREIFAILAAKGYGWYLSYEAPDPAAWSRDPEQVAREALEATRGVLPT